MKLTLVRHGESVDNISNICQGQTDGELSPKGILQAQAVAHLLEQNNSRYAICYTSDLHRACQTADIIASKLDLSISKDHRLRERYFGKYQGLVMPSSWNGLAAYESAEPIVDMVKRIEDFIAEISSNFADKEVLIISHGITLRLMVAICLQSDNDLGHLDNCSISHLETTSSKSFHLIDYNSSLRLFRH